MRFHATSATDREVMTTNISDQILGVLADIWGGRRVPLHEPLLGGREIELVSEAIQSTFVSSVGAFVDDFECKLAEYVGSSYVIPMVNGTSALHLGLLAIGVEQDTEVLMSPLTFIASGNAIRYCGAHPTFIDIETETLGLCPDKLEEFLASRTRSSHGSILNISTGLKISAIMPVHVFGHVCKMKEICAVAASYNLSVLEDAAEALGSSRYGTHAGTFGAAGVLSFNGNKLITTGGGGALVTQDTKIAERVRHMSTTAKVSHPYEFRHDSLGFNYRMPNLNAALGVAQLERVSYLLAKKRLLYASYVSSFRAVAGTTVLGEPVDGTSNFWLNTLLLSADYAENLIEILKTVNDHGYYCRPCWQLIHNSPQFKSSCVTSLDNATDLSERIISLPSGIYE